jgi:hypothetical protein
MRPPETPFPRHWLYYIFIKLVVIAVAVALVPVSRFRSSQHLASRSHANFGIEGHWQLYASSVPWDLKFLCEGAARL